MYAVITTDTSGCDIITLSLIEIPFIFCSGGKETTSIIVNAHSLQHYSFSEKVVLRNIIDNKIPLPCSIETHLVRKDVVDYYTTQDFDWFLIAEKHGYVKYLIDKTHVGIQMIKKTIWGRDNSFKSRAVIVYEITIFNGTSLCHVPVPLDDIYNYKVFQQASLKYCRLAYPHIKDVKWKLIVDFFIEHTPDMSGDPNTQMAFAFLNIANKKDVKFRFATIQYLINTISESEFRAFLETIPAEKIKSVISIEDIVEIPASVEVKELRKRLDDIADKESADTTKTLKKRIKDERKVMADLLK